MGSYKQVSFEDLNDDQKDIAIALLSDGGYEGFEEDGYLLKAYISSEDFDEKKLTEFAWQYHLSFSINEIKNRNWNQVWESNFDPVIIDGFVAIRAGFHKPVKNVQHEIVITPKMSFGTGHHATTLMMIKMMREIDFKDKRVLDFGTGTGILAILAERLGASRVLAIDNDDRSIENAKENFWSNGCTKIRLTKAFLANSNHEFDIILANIIKSVILVNFSQLAAQLIPGGIMLLSGLLKDDEQEIVQTAIQNNMSVKGKIEDENWICLQVIMNRLLPEN